MRIGAFECVEPLPALRSPHALVMLRPWIDAGSVGALALLEIEQHFGVTELCRVARPGSFYDFTRYRPTAYFREDQRELSVPNTVINLVRREQPPDLVTIKMLEPHMFAEVFIDSVLALLGKLGIVRYFWMGSMYDMVPHTRPLLVSGGAYGSVAREDVRRLDVRPTSYQGPSTLTFQIVQRAPLMGIDSMWCVVHLPQYVQVEEDYVGKVRLMEILNTLYGVPIDADDVERAREQTATVDAAVAEDPQLTAALPHIEARYEAQVERAEGATTPLSPELERLLHELADDEDEQGPFSGPQSR